MPKSCLNHQDHPAVTNCHQCHRPICKSCTIVTPHGTFCSSACSVLNREFKERTKAMQSERKSSRTLQGMLALLLVAAAFIGIHLIARYGFKPAQKVDIVGRILERISKSSP